MDCVRGGVISACSSETGERREERGDRREERGEVRQWGLLSLSRGAIEIFTSTGVTFLA